ncbi:MAG TPA: hypothetical protein VMF08_09245 [Candidatus Sulfotelmatobacter sp.]|nr:hypothetical protein [Candidatus Sulfotelmatobacter sp.]
MPCSVAKCKKKEFKEGYCADHFREAKAKEAKPDKPVYSWKAGLIAGQTDPNDTFYNLCVSDTQDAPYLQRIEKLCSDGPQEAKQENVHGIPCLHDTQKGANVTIWYSWKGNIMTVWGLGSHSGGNGARNNNYQMTWYDGKSKNWDRRNSK